MPLVTEAWPVLLPWGGWSAELFCSERGHMDVGHAGPNVSIVPVEHLLGVGAGERSRCGVGVQQGASGLTQAH